jgi:hypothetical protein
MSRGNIETRYIDDIYVIKFEELNELMEKQYPNYRNKSSFFSLFNIAFGGGYNSIKDVMAAFTDNAYFATLDAISPQFSSDVGEIIIDPPKYLNYDIKPI